ncbi:UDP-N-acetylenolpyruvoylglucosamine reductase [Candidatus Peregrinibacteria bacterium CG10_big_fil_rev_8_21_14_0_10_49_10]|nr:MAG: UDP-N-acetylenolpyruvoylglucosamine reductase [Candidatus Peregrinibacteria bacterium CG10_big_fil_rev_8_21_14_0_10_49_10]
MEIAEHVPLAPKTTMRIGGTARYFAEPTSQEEIEEAVAFAEEKNIPYFVLGSGSNTIFADGEVQALILRIKADTVEREGNTLRVQTGKNLAMLINELAEQGLDLSPLTGIPGTVGGALFGNAGQGPTGIWMDSFVNSVTALVAGRWRTYPKSECGFLYRESLFKRMDPAPILWEVSLTIPLEEPAKIAKEVERLLQKRIETQPHSKTAGSCFKAVAGTPAWKLIDAAGLRGEKIGGVEIAQKHANFLLNDGTATFADVVSVVEKVTQTVNAPLEVEMRLVEQDGRVREIEESTR